jgi:hypothetical protein
VWAPPGRDFLVGSVGRDGVRLPEVSKRFDDARAVGKPGVVPGTIVGCLRCRFAKTLLYPIEAEANCRGWRMQAQN